MKHAQLAIVTSTPIIMHYRSYLKQQLAKQPGLLQRTSTFTFLKRAVLYCLIWSAGFCLTGMIVAITRACVHNHVDNQPSHVDWIVGVMVFCVVSTVCVALPFVWIVTLGMSVIHLTKCASKSSTFGPSPAASWNGKFPLIHRLWEEVRSIM